MKVYRSVPEPCPSCGQLQDSLTGVTGNETRPRPGDFGYCMSCGEVHVLSETLSRRLPNEDELLIIAEDETAIKIRKAFRQMKANSPS